MKVPMSPFVRMLNHDEREAERKATKDRRENPNLTCYNTDTEASNAVGEGQRQDDAGKQGQGKHLGHFIDCRCP